MVLMSRGTLFVLSAPSGAGKTTLAHELSRRLKARGIVAEFSVSYTTRAPRPGEKEGSDYHFVSEDTFRSMIEEGEFLEHARVFGNRYGTGRAATEAVLDSGRNLILDIDWQGAKQLRASLRSDCITVFILPPSRETLRARLIGRGQDSEDTVDYRMDQAIGEISHYAEFDYLIVNDELQRAADELEAVCHARSLRTTVQAVAHAGLIEELLD